MMPDAARLSAALEGRYRADREIGAGGMATVHLARDIRHDRDVAIKVLRPSLAQSLGRERFVREIRLAASLHHPHILPLYDSGEADGIVSALQVQLTSTDDARLGSRRISDPRGFELYLQARNELRRYGTPTDRAGILLRRAIEIEGETPPLRALRAFMEFSKVRGGSSADLRPLDVAEAEARALIALDADAPYGHALLGFVGYERGQLPAAARHLTRAHELDPSDTNAPELPYTVQLSALVDAMEGRRDAALEALARLDLAALDAHHIFHIAEAYAMAGDTPRALTLLERAVDHGMYPYRFYTEHCPFTVPLRGSPEFARIVDKAARRVAEFSA